VNIIIWDQDRKNFSNTPESLYDQKNVCITGFVETLNNVPQIVLRNRNQITLNTPVPLAEIDKFVGDSVTVSGKVVTTKLVSSSPTSPIMLNLGAAYPNQLLTLLIEDKNREMFNGSPENYYLNKEIRVKGRVELYMGKPQIVVQNKDQITELSGPAGDVVNRPAGANNNEQASATTRTSGSRNVEKSASFPGGQDALLKFLKNNLVWPKNELDIGEKKVVVVRFLINPDGSAANIKITQPGGTNFDKEVIRVLKLMPKWEPQISNGIPVTVSVTQPITFVRPQNTGAKKSGS
jgi:TonB family protein